MPIPSTTETGSAAGLRLETWSSSLLRIVTALLMLGHPVQKFFGFPVWSRFGFADALSLPGIAGLIEIVAGSLLLIGLYTRAAAFILSGTMAFAYFIVHAPRSFFPIENGGELAVLFCFTLLYHSAAGAGSISVDELCRGRCAPAD